MYESSECGSYSDKGEKGVVRLATSYQLSVLEITHGFNKIVYFEKCK